MKYSPSDIYLMCRTASVYFKKENQDLSLDNEETRKLWYQKHGFYIQHPIGSNSQYCLLHTPEDLLIVVTPLAVTVRAAVNEIENVVLLKATEKDYHTIEFNEDWHFILEELLDALDEKYQELTTRHKSDPQLQEKAKQLLIEKYHRNKLRKELMQY